jgi:metallophosphoesterase (TIGR00282 family)
MQVNLLCIGDVVGRPGRFVVSQALPGYVRQNNIHCVICNVENAAGGSGFTPQLYDKFRRYGVSLMTLGDHIYRRPEIIPVLERSPIMVKPVNYPPVAPGHVFAVADSAAGPKVAVLSIMGRLFMKPSVDCPFRSIDRVLQQIPAEVKIIVVDVHAEATSEKVALGWHLDGRVSVVFGTHTHIPTADERVLPGGTAYISDLGMTGPYDSVLGRRKDRVIKHLVTNLPAPFDVAEGDVRLCGIRVQVESTTGKATHIERVNIPATDYVPMPENAEVD